VYYILIILYDMEFSAFCTHSCTEVILFKDSESAGEVPASLEADGMFPAAVDTDDSGALHMASDQVTK
jgi:hypothetical protein